MKHFFYQIIFACLLFICAGNQLQAQVVITYPTAAQPLTRGLNVSKLTVNLGFTGTCTGTTVQVRLPLGVEYVPGTVIKTGGAGGVTITAAGGAVRTPSFTISNAVVGNDITFTIDRIANCGSGSSGKDSIYVTSSCGSFNETVPVTNNYNILAPALSITPPATITNAAIGSNYSRTFTVTNGGNGCLDTLQLFVVRTAGSIGSPVINIGAAVIPVHHTSGDTTFYRIFGANLPGGDNLMCNGETVTFTETFTLVNCLNLNSTFGAGWGRDKNVGAQCGVSTGTGLINLASGVPNITSSYAAPAITACGTVPRPITLTLTNSGASPATNISVKIGSIYGNTFYPYSYFIDTAGVTVTLPSGAPYHPAGITVTNVLSVNGSSPGCASGKPGEMVFNLPAGFILPAGQSITIVYSIKTCPMATCTEGGNYDSGSSSAEVTYKDQCGSQAYTMPYASNSIPQGITLGGSGPIEVEAPAQVFAGSCFTYKLYKGLSYSSGYPNAYQEYKITLPAGVTFNSVTEALNGTAPLAGYPQVVGNVVTVRYPLDGNIYYQPTFTLCVAAGTCGPQTLITEGRATLDNTCAVPLMTLSCANTTFVSVCNQPCPSGGATPSNWTFERTTFGIPDNNNDGIPDASGSIDLTKVEKAHYRPGDIMHANISSVVSSNTIVPYASWPFVYAEWSFGAAQWTPQSTATIVIKRSGSIIQTITGITPSTLTANTKFKADWSSSLPGGFTYQNGDSVIVQADFKLTGNTVVSAGNAQSPYGGRAKLLGTLTANVYASQTANPPAGGLNGPDRFSCFTPQYNYYIIGSEHFPALFRTDLAGATGCNNFTVTGDLYTVVQDVTSIRYFPYEHRATHIPDSVIYNVPAGWAYQGTSTTMFSNGAPGHTNTTAIPIVPTVTGTAATGITLTYDFKAAIASSIIPYISTEGMDMITNVSLKPSCSATTSGIVTMTEKGHFAYYPSSASPQYYSLATTVALNYNAGNRPNIVLQNNTGIVQGVSPQQYWDVQVNNPSSQTAPFVWFSLEKGAGGIAVDSVVLKPSNVVLTPTAYGASDKWYKVSASLLSGGNQAARVYFKYSGCALDSIKASIGWNCAGYPAANPNEAGACAQQTQYLKVQSQTGQVQLSIEKQPTTPNIAMCATDSVVAIINSASGANVDNPTVTIIPPAGLLIINPIEVEYPLNSGNWQTVTAANVGGNFVINLEQHTGIGAAGLPGVLVNPAAEPRQARIKFKYTSSCPFVSGSRLGFIVNGQNPCGTTASLGNNDYINSLPINITGAIAPGSAGMMIDVNPPELSCDNVVTVPFNITPVSLGTQVGDKAVYTLPAGIQYAGGFTPGANCVGCTIAQTAGTGGATILTVSLPAGVPANTTMGFTLNLQTGGVAPCGNTLISGQAEREIAGLNCNSTVCPSGHAVIGSVTQSIIIKKPKVNITGLTFTQTGSTINYSATLTNVGTQNAPAGYMVKIHCGSSTAGPVVYSFLTTAAIPAGATTVLTGSYVNNPATCPGGSAIFAQLQDTLANGMRICACGPSIGAISQQVVPVKLESFTGRADGCKAVLSWKTTEEINLSRYEIEYSANGSSFSKIGSLQGLNNLTGGSYKFTYAQPDLKGYYRLKIIDMDGRPEYSNVISLSVDCNKRIIYVSPNPSKGIVNVTGVKKGDYLQLFSMDGRLLLKKQATGMQITLDISGYPQDVYTVKVYTSEGDVKTTKLVKIQ